MTCHQPLGILSQNLQSHSYTITHGFKFEVKQISGIIGSHVFSSNQSLLFLDPRLAFHFHYMIHFHYMKTKACFSLSLHDTHFYHSKRSSVAMVFIIKYHQTVRANTPHWIKIAFDAFARCADYPEANVSDVTSPKMHLLQKLRQ